jgi:hypothetical protein
VATDAKWGRMIIRKLLLSGIVPLKNLLIFGEKTTFAKYERNR